MAFSVEMRVVGDMEKLVQGGDCLAFYIFQLQCTTFLSFDLKNHERRGS